MKGFKFYRFNYTSNRAIKCRLLQIDYKFLLNCQLLYIVIRPFYYLIGLRTRLHCYLTNSNKKLN